MEGRPVNQADAPLRILHVGAGREALPLWLPGIETRLDIDPAMLPNIVAHMTAMGSIGPFDVVYCCHALEHIYPHEVPVALGEFYRVLAPGGRLVLFVPDLEDVRPTEEVLYVSPAGPVAGLDLYYGLRARIPERPHMAHHTGFIRETLADAVTRAGFADVMVTRLSHHNLVAGAIRR